MEKGMFEVLETAPDKIEWFEKVVGKTGVNPELVYDERMGYNRTGEPTDDTDYPLLPAMNE